MIFLASPIYAVQGARSHLVFAHGQVAISAKTSVGQAMCVCMVSLGAS